MHTVLFFCLPLTVLIQSDVIMLSNIFSPYFVEVITHHMRGRKLKIKGYFNKVVIYLFNHSRYIYMYIYIYIYIYTHTSILVYI